MTKRITALTGPSCAGKSTLERMMAERGCLRAISTTTRAPRPGEKEGVDYYFIDKAQHKRMMVSGAFIEYTKFGDNYYGLMKAEVERLFNIGDHIVVVVEPVGSKQMRLWAATQPDIELKRVFVTNPSSVIAERFLRRVINDLRGIEDESSADAVLKMQKLMQTYTGRLSLMLTEEAEWQREAREYDLWVTHFDSSNGVAVANILAKEQARA